MSKINNLVLAGILMALALTFVLTKIFRSPRLESNVRKDLIVLDTANVNELLVRAAGTDGWIKIARAGQNWTLEKEQKKYAADAATIKSVLGMIARVEAQRMISRKKDKWDTFQVGDNATVVSIHENGKQKANLHIGKSGFSQANGGMMGGGGYTYVRLGDEDEVYLVNGFLESTFGRPFDDWRDKTFLRVPRDLVKKISFRYPADSSFVLEKKDSLWTVAGGPVDQTRVDTFLGQLSYKNLNTFADAFSAGSPATAVLQIDGASGALCTIEAWKADAGWVLRSSRQPDVFFSATGSTVDKDLLVSRSHFVKK
jgi:hypothetical protein